MEVKHFRYNFIEYLTYNADHTPTSFSLWIHCLKTNEYHYLGFVHGDSEECISDEELNELQTRLCYFIRHNLRQLILKIKEGNHLNTVRRNAILKDMSATAKKERNREIVEKRLKDPQQWSFRKLGNHFNIKESTVYEIFVRETTGVRIKKKLSTPKV